PAAQGRVEQSARRAPVRPAADPAARRPAPSTGAGGARERPGDGPDVRVRVELRQGLAGRRVEAEPRLERRPGDARCAALDYAAAAPAVLEHPTEPRQERRAGEERRPAR